MANVPTGVKIISVLHYIGAAILLIGGIVAFVGSAFLTTVIPDIVGGLVIAIGILSIILAVLYFFIARGLWKGQNWARIVAIILAILGVINGLVSVVSGRFGSIVSLIIYAIIAYYLWFGKEVKTAFH